MPRIALVVPYNEKDEAKKLGARWDKVNKVWFIPEGINTGPFRRWIIEARPSQIPVKRDLPKTVFFSKREDGSLAARIDNLEVGFEVDGGCYIIQWDNEKRYACEEGVCPEGENNYLDTICPHPVDCPYFDLEEMQGGTTFLGREGSYVELAAVIRGLLKNKEDGFGHHKKWPQPAASEFVAASWQFENVGEFIDWQPIAPAINLPSPDTRILAVAHDPNLPDDLFCQRRISSLSDIDPIFWQNNRIPLLTRDESDLLHARSAGAEIDQQSAFIRMGQHGDLNALRPLLPFVAKGIIMPMLGDLIPSSSWGSSLNNLLTLESWNSLRRKAFAVTGNRCEICGSADEIECHEYWEYHEPQSPYSEMDACGVQRLVRLMALCKLCHETQHLGLAQARGRYDIASKRIAAYNRWNDEELAAYRNFIIDRYERRSEYKWILDVSICNDAAITVRDDWQLDASGFLSKNTRTGLSETMLLGVAWKHRGSAHAAISPDIGYYS